LKKQWIHRARKLDSYNWDEDDKQKVIDIVRTSFGIHLIRDAVVVHNGKARYPDLKSTNYSPLLFVELDGEYHGAGDEITETTRTGRRNEFYQKQNLQLIVINKEATEGYKKERVIEVLEANGVSRQL